MIDIDETALSNMPAIKAWLNGVNNVGDVLPKTVLAVINNAFKDKANKPILNLYKDARSHGVAVFFVTGRNAGLVETPKTAINLRRAGYKGYADLYLRRGKQRQMTARQYKNEVARCDIVGADKYDLVLAIGDQLSDIPTVADRGFKLPNPYYFIV
jgi:predicted secreted acid phosphatase